MFKKTDDLVQEGVLNLLLIYMKNLLSGGRDCSASTIFHEETETFVSPDQRLKSALCPRGQGINAGFLHSLWLIPALVDVKP